MLQENSIRYETNLDKKHFQPIIKDLKLELQKLFNNIEIDNIYICTGEDIFDLHIEVSQKEEFTDMYLNISENGKTLVSSPYNTGDFRNIFDGQMVDSAIEAILNIKKERLYSDN